MSRTATDHRIRFIPVIALAALFATGCSDDPTPVAPPSGDASRPAVGTTYTVTNTNDAGPGSLRQAIADGGSGGTIVFDAAIAGQTITLASALAINTGGTFIIDGGATKGMTLSGGG